MKKFFVVMLALAALVAFTAPAFAAAGPTVQLGARINQVIGYNSRSEELTSSGKDVTGAFVNLVGNSYWRAKFMSADKKAGVMVEIGLPGVNTRFAYGWYKIGNCQLIAGWTGNWFTYDFFPIGTRNAVAVGDGIGWGMLYAPRRPMVMIEWLSGGIGVQFSLEQATTQGPTNWFPGYLTSSTGTAVDPMSGVDSYYKIPRVSLSARFKTPNFIIQPGVNYNRTDFEGTRSGIDDSVTSYGLFVPMQLNVGGFRAMFQFHYTTNPRGPYSTMPTFAGAVVKEGGSFEDTINYGGILELAYKIGALELCVGAGMEYFTNDEWKDTLGWKEDNYTRQLFYLTTPYTVHKNMFIYPEFNYLVHGDTPQTGDDGGNEWVLGVMFRFLF